MKRVGIIFSIILFLALTFFLVTDTRSITDHMPIITNNFVDLEKIDEISKYRSCAGHVVVPTAGNERKRNMKHYFNIKEQYRDEANGIPIYSPFAGDIVGIRDIEGKPFDEEISIAPANSRWEVSMLHIDVVDDLRENDKVIGGQIIGYAKQRGFDIVYHISAGPTEQRVIEGWYGPYKDLDSIFNHMSDEVFGQYIKAGVVSRDQIVLTKEQRDTEPCLYRDQAPDLEHPIDREDNWVDIS